jgi:ABC-type Fe3+-siderophore transport system permease subunit
MQRILILILAGLCIFTVVAAIMIKVMPAPLKESDFMVIGSVATLVALLVLFVVLISTTMKSSNLFFRKRRK